MSSHDQHSVGFQIVMDKGEGRRSVRAHNAVQTVVIDCSSKTADRVGVSNEVIS